MDKIRCNMCGKYLKQEKDIVVEDYVKVCKPWGYFSEKDGITHEFVMCEKCFDDLEKKFVVPIKKYDTKEMI